MGSLNELKVLVPDFAKDIKLNLSTLIENSDYEDDLVFGCAYASALALDNDDLIDVFDYECKQRFPDDYIESVKSTVVIMSLNNAWYKYRDAMPTNEMRLAAQKMRVNAMRNHAGLDKILFESLSLCISAVNGCNFCIKAHSSLLLDSGKTKEYVLTIGRIASVTMAAAKALQLR